MIGCIRCHGPTDGNGNCPFCDWQDVTKEQVESIDKALAPEFADGEWETVEKEDWTQPTTHKRGHG